MNSILITIVRALFGASAETRDFSLTERLRKRPETRILPLVIKNCPECCNKSMKLFIYLELTSLRAPRKIDLPIAETLGVS
jgi:hypothetical protein